MVEFYHASVKERFIRSITKPNQAALCRNIFHKTAPEEFRTEKDLCSWDEAQLRPLVEQFAGLRTTGRAAQMSLLRRYAAWCDEHTDFFVSDAVFKIKIDGSDAIRNQSVSGPDDFQRYLDAIYDPESLKTVGCVYRCYMWLAYCGLEEEEDAFYIRCADVDVERRFFYCNGERYELYPEAVRCFEIVSKLPVLKYIHPNYGEVYQPRASGLDGTEDTLLRTLRPISSIVSFRSIQSRLRKQAVDDGRTTKRIGYLGAFHSGQFYRQYVTENLFSMLPYYEKAERYYWKPDPQERDFYRDYERWKAVYYPKES